MPMQLTALICEFHKCKFYYLCVLVAAFCSTSFTLIIVGEEVQRSCWSTTGNTYFQTRSWNKREDSKI